MVVGEITRVVEARRDVFARQVRRLADNLIVSLPRREIAKNQGHRNASAINTRLAAEYVRRANDVLTPGCFLTVGIHLSSLTSCRILRGYSSTHKYV